MNATAVVVVVCVLVGGLGMAPRPEPLDPSARPSPSPTATARYRLPLAASTMLVRAFEAPAAAWGPGHRGVDLAAEIGGEVIAPAAGTVSFAGPVAGRSVLTVVHDDGLRSSVEPVVPDVTAGDRVEAGATIGYVQGPALGLEPGAVEVAGHTAAPHCPGTTCLHWGVRRTDTYVDPLRLLVGRAVLLPGP